jgi:hypothetical protein
VNQGSLIRHGLGPAEALAGTGAAGTFIGAAAVVLLEILPSPYPVFSKIGVAEFAVE